jgi:activator of HSP90 ATPase
MTKPVIQSVRFKAAPETLYRLYMNSAEHAAATGAPARLSTKAGGKWSAYGGMIGGKNLLLVPGRRIVQSWRAKFWNKKDADSILILTFSKAPGGARVDLVHVGIPSYDQKGVRKGWPRYYWKPWKKYLAGTKSAKRK